MGLFGAAHGRGDLKTPLLKICDTYPTTHNDKGCHSYTWPKEDLKKSINYEFMKHLLISADISNFSQQFSDLLYIVKYRQKLYFDILFLILLSFSESL